MNDRAILMRLIKLGKQVHDDLHDFEMSPTAEGRGKINDAIAEITELLNDFEIKG